MNYTATLSKQGGRRYRQTGLGATLSRPLPAKGSGGAPPVTSVATYIPTWRRRRR